MRTELHELSISVKQTDVDLKAIAAKKLDISESDIHAFEIKRRSLDARKKHDIRYKYSLILDMPDALAQRLIVQKKVTSHTPVFSADIKYGSAPMQYRPVVVGAGPAGLFAAYTLAKHGFRPLVIERGKPIEQRRKDVEELHQNSIFKSDSNVCFGEGGAGTFSDGKLTTRIKDPRCGQVLDAFVACGADPSIRYLAKPHLGTDGMQAVIVALRKKLEAMGCDILFNTKLAKLIVENDRIGGLINQSENQTTELQTDIVILATGHSAGDTYRMLYDVGAMIEKKPCAVGFRIEHSRDMIDQAQYGDFAGKYGLGSAEYSLTAKHENRGVYSFCMCPGGEVVCASSAEESLCINGMSHSNRDMKNSNSAVVVTLKAEDCPNHPLGVLEFIESLEKQAFRLGGGYLAPSQKVFDFMTGKITDRFDIIKPTYRPGVIAADLNGLLPSALNEALKAGLKQFDRRITGFIDLGVLTGVETRTSSPVRLTRGENGESLTLGGLYPAGEGAGYAGGIISAAVDGIRTAEHVICAYRP